MTMQRVVDILKTEKECVERAGTSTPNKACDRACADCDLVLDDKEILEAYTLAIGCVEGVMADNHKEAPEMAIKAIEQQPCEDVPDNNVGEKEEK